MVLEGQSGSVFLQGKYPLPLLLFHSRPQCISGNGCTNLPMAQQKQGLTLILASWWPAKLWYAMTLEASPPWKPCGSDASMPRAVAAAYPPFESASGYQRLSLSTTMHLVRYTLIAACDFHAGWWWNKCTNSCNELEWQNVNLVNELFDFFCYLNTLGLCAVLQVFQHPPLLAN